MIPSEKWCYILKIDVSRFKVNFPRHFRFFQVALCFQVFFFSTFCFQIRVKGSWGYLRPKPFYFWNQCRKKSDPTYNDSGIEWWISRWISPIRLKWRYSKSRAVLCRIRLFPTLISKIKWILSQLPLNKPVNFSLTVADPDISGILWRTGGHNNFSR